MLGNIEMGEMKSMEVAKVLGRAREYICKGERGNCKCTQKNSFKRENSISNAKVTAERLLAGPKPQEEWQEVKLKKLELKEEPEKEALVLSSFALVPKRVYTWSYLFSSAKHIPFLLLVLSINTPTSPVSPRISPR